MSADYLVHRGTTWYFQIRRSEKMLQYSLKTKDFMYAKWLAIGIVREIANLKKKTQITDESIKSLVKTMISMSLDSLEFTRAQGSDNAFILTPSTMQKLASGKSEIGDVFAKAYEQQNKLKLTDLEHNDLARRFTTAFLQISNIEQERMKGNYMNPHDAQSFYYTSDSKQEACNAPIRAD